MQNSVAFLPRQSLSRVLLLLLVSIALSSCAPLSHKVISLNGTGTENPVNSPIIDVDLTHPLLLVGLDGNQLSSVEFQSQFRTYSFIISPGKHVLWLSNVPYGLPLIPQRLRCYSMDVILEPSSKYILKEAPMEKIALLLPQSGGVPVASGRLIDNPLVFERRCRWR